MILLLLSVYFNNYDFSLSQDKVAHIGLGYTTSSVSYWGLCTVTDNSTSTNILSSIAMSAFIGIAKENYDYNRTGKASLGDLTYTIIGGAIGAIISNWLFHGG